MVPLLRPNGFCRVDFHNNILIVGYPTSPGHEIVGDMFHRLDKADSYPLVLYRGSQIVECGTADVPLTQGTKSCNFSLYEVTHRGEHGKSE